MAESNRISTSAAALAEADFVKHCARNFTPALRCPVRGCSAVTKMLRIFSPSGLRDHKQKIGATGSNRLALTKERKDKMPTKKAKVKVKDMKAKKNPKGGLNFTKKLDAASKIRLEGARSQDFH